MLYIRKIMGENVKKNNKKKFKYIIQCHIYISLFNKNNIKYNGYIQCYNIKNCINKK